MERPQFSELPLGGGIDVVNVIAGGPSLAGYPVERLSGLRIGASGAGLRSGAEITIGAGGPFWPQCGPEIVKALDEGRRVFHPIRPHVRPDQLPADMDPRVELLKWPRSRGLSHNRDAVIGLDSGFLCFNAALLLRPRRINLFGLDYTSPEFDRHWHAGYQLKAKRYDQQLASWVMQYTHRADEIDKLRGDAEIVHYVGGEFGSRLDLFPQRPLDEAFEELAA